MKKVLRRKTFSLGLAIVMLCALMLSGCSLISVNPEKDNAKVMMTVGGEDKIFKKDYNNAMAYLVMMYSSQGSNLPTGKDLKALKQEVYDEVIQLSVMAEKAEKDGTKFDKAQAEKDGQSAYDAIKKQVGNKYDSILKAWCSNDEMFKTYMVENSVRSAKAQAALEAYNDKIEKDPKSYLDQSIAQYNLASNDDAIDITKGEYFYYYILEELNNYMTTQALLEDDEDTQKGVNETIAENIATNGGLIKYCEDNKITIDNAKITEEQKTLQSNIDMFFQDETTFNSYLSGYHLTAKLFKEYQAKNAKAEAAKSAIKQKAAKDAEISDKDIEKHFNENKNTYDQSQVSACHILTEDKSFAQQIATEAKGITKKEDFQKLMDQYKDNEKVSEATDLGAFDRAKMVEEFSNAAFSQDENTVSGPVKTEFGYHVIFVYKKDIKEVKLDDHKEAIRQTLKDEKGEETYENVEKDIKKQINAKIDIQKKGTDEFVEAIKSELNIEVKELSL